MNTDKLQDYALSDDELNSITGGVQVVDIRWKSETSTGSSVGKMTINASRLEEFKEKHKENLQRYTFSEPREWKKP
jgi:bacteriocin-like protein